MFYHIKKDVYYFITIEAEKNLSKVNNRVEI